MSMERLPFEHRPRNSIANNLDKINELIDWANQDTYLYASASGERVTADDASSLKGLTVDGRSVQDGTPTPDAPVAVQVVEGPLSLVIGDASVAIDLQGNTLASLPDGTKDVLGIDSAGRVKLTKNVGVATLSSDLTVNSFTTIGIYSRAIFRNACSPQSKANASSGYCSHSPFSGGWAQDAQHVYTDGTSVVGTAIASTVEQLKSLYLDAKVYYPLATPTTIDLGYIDPPAIPSGSVVTVSASLAPTFTLEWWVDDGITELVDDLIAYIDYKTEG